MSEMSNWNEVSASWMNVWGDDIAVKTEFEQVFDAENIILNSTPQVGSVRSSDLDLTPEEIDSIPTQVSNEETVSTSPRLISKEELAPRYLNSEFVKEETDPGAFHFIKYVIRDGKHSKVWECGICNKEFGQQYTLMRHLPTHTNERKFQCNTCGKAFRQMSTLSQHRAIHSADRPYVCELCQKTFNRVSTLISHRKTHSGLKPHQCHLCPKAFHQKGNLRNHIFTHTNERPYKCDICQKGFNQMSNLMCHKLKVHQRNDKPKHICGICNKEFPKRVGLRNHEEYKHGIKLENNPVPTARVRYTNGVLIDAIQTREMERAKMLPSAPFALLRPISGIPVLVRVLSAPEGKHMLVPATAEDLRAHEKVTITNGTHCPSSSVQITIPVVATVLQRFAPDGTISITVESPGPNNNKLIQDSILNTVENRGQSLDPQIGGTGYFDFQSKDFLKNGNMENSPFSQDLTQSSNYYLDPTTAIEIIDREKPIDFNPIVGQQNDSLTLYSQSTPDGYKILPQFSDLKSSFNIN